MSKSRYLALRNASATATTPAFRKGRQVRMDDADAKKFVEAGALKPLGLPPESNANVPQASSSEPTVNSLLPEKSELDASTDGQGLMTPSADPSGEPVGELTTDGIQAAKDATDNDPSKATEEVADEPAQSLATEATTEVAAEEETKTEVEPQASTDVTETEAEPEAETQTETAEVNESDDSDTVTYEVAIDDPDGAYTSWFNELAASKGIGVTFEASSGRPRVELPADIDSETLNGWVAAFRSAYPDFASVTAAPVQ